MARRRTSGTVAAVDWLWMTPYGASGTLTSDAVDAAPRRCLWQKLTMTRNLPSGTTVTVTYRTGNTPVPDASWTAFTAPEANALTGTSRYMQFAIQLGSTSTAKTPVVQDVTLQYKR